MVFGLFDPPQTKAQKRAAKLAQALREQAVRDMLIELRMLINTQEQGRQVQQLLYRAGHPDAALKMMAVVDAAQETMERVGRFNEMFPRELAELQRAATNAAGFEALANFELEGRDMMVMVRDEAKSQLIPLGIMVREGRGLLN